MAWRSASVSVPLRGFCFSTFLTILANKNFPHKVSVPLRGFCFSTPTDSHRDRLAAPTCFRPLTGILFFNWTSCCRRPAFLKRFPSPYGDFVFQPRTHKKVIMIGKGFPSPYGDFVFQQAAAQRLYARWEWLWFPSPYGDFVFQPARKGNVVMAIEKLFPSPYGDFVFQRGRHAIQVTSP